LALRGGRRGTGERRRVARRRVRLALATTRLPDCDAPVPNFAASPLPFMITWNPVNGVTYYQIRYGLASH